MFNIFKLLTKPKLPDGVEFISVKEAEKALNAGEFDLLLDVRSAEEWEKGRIPGARFVPVTELQNRIGELAQRKNDKILVYCHTQNRSSRAAWVLSENGFTNVRVMYGGIAGWAKENYPLEA